MKKKILGIFVCTLLIATVLPAVGTMNVDEPKLVETPVNPDFRTPENMNKGGPLWHIGPICWLPDCDWNYWDDSDILYTHELTDRVGIGTANPTDKLHISVSGTKNEGILIEHTGTYAAQVLFDGGGNGSRRYGLYSTGPDNYQGAGIFVIRDFAATADRIAIIANGNVGIGTYMPQSRLHVTSDSSTTGDTGITIEIPGIGTRRVLVGPPDSGGSGFRMLRVAN